MRKMIGSRVTDGRTIIKAKGWVAYYIIFSFAQVAFGLLLAITRIILLVITSLVAINRLDRNLFTVGQRLDNGYGSFMGMVAMVQAMEAKERRGWPRVRFLITTERYRDYKRSFIEHGEDKNLDDLANSKANISASRNRSSEFVQAPTKV